VSAEQGDLTKSFDLQAWLRSTCADYVFQPVGTYISESPQGTWPLELRAEDPDQLVRALRERGHLQPLPTESAALANVVEVSLSGFLLAAAEQVQGLDLVRGTDRGYPDLEFTGALLNNKIWAVDIKVAMRNKGARTPTTTQSRITLYTGNTYFKYPDLPLPGILRPFNEYAGHLDIIVLYTYGDDENRVSDIRVVVHEPWRIASRERASTTREYIGAVNRLQDLVDGNGAFETPDEFYKYWRKYPFKQSTVVVNVLERLRRAGQSNT
jgi:hypothetical protein